MAINERVLRLIETSGAKFQVLPHAEAFTAQEVAQSVHVTGRVMAKVVVVRDEGGAYAMLVVPASCHLDLAAFARQAGLRGATLATETELQRLFPDCELGAMPPLGRLYDLPTYVDRAFGSASSVYFQAGNHHEVVRMDTADFLRLAQGRTGDFCAAAPAGDV
ncbi:MAG TPA: YbaK/EbsC family protein [Terriglobales bacterium]|nr:YbaK/EbsC family protein [Terriglobales bacterium]